jgi:hypothetical protein
MKVWYENSLKEWSINFSNIKKIFADQTEPSKQISLRPSPRAPNFYYRDKNNTWVPLSLSSNSKIDKYRATAKDLSQIPIREIMQNTGVMDKILRNSRVNVDLKKFILCFHQETFDLTIEKNLDYYWQYENPRDWVKENTPLLKLQPNDTQFIKVKNAFKLTMPQNNVKTVIRYFLPEYETFLTTIKKMQSQVDKLLWSWEFTTSPCIAVNKNLDSNNPYGTGYQFASSANIAVKLREKKISKISAGDGLNR